MKKRLTYGMVGGGPDAFIGDAHRRSISLDLKAEIVAGCFSRDLDKNRQTADSLFIDENRCYPDYKQMAAGEKAREDKIDFVVVVTPNSSHYEICREFLEAGIHVSCDKPVTTEAWQAEELEALAKSKGLLFLVTYTYSGHVTVKHAAAIIRKGAIGKVRSVMAEYPQGWLAFEDDDGGKQGAWRLDPTQSGRVNALGDIGTHVQNTVAHITGLKLKKVLARMDSVVPGRVLDDNDMVMVEFDNGATGMFWSSQFAIGSDNSLRVRVYGSEGTILWFQETPETITIINKSGEIRELHRGHAGIDPAAAKYQRLPSGHDEGWFEAMANLYSSFIDCIVAKKKGSFTEEMIDYPTISAGVDSLRYVEACLQSSDNGNIWVEL